MKTSFNFDGSHIDNEPNFCGFRHHVEWPGGDGILYLSTCSLSDAGFAVLSANADGNSDMAGGGPITTPGAHEFWAPPGTVLLDAGIPGGENGSVSLVGSIYKR